MNPFNTPTPGLVVTDATLAEWLAAGGSLGSLASATLEPIEAPEQPNLATTRDRVVVDVFCNSTAPE